MLTDTFAVFYIKAIVIFYDKYPIRNREEMKRCVTKEEEERKIDQFTFGTDM